MINFIRIKNFSKDTVEKIKRQFEAYEKIFTKHIAEKTLVSRTIKEFFDPLMYCQKASSSLTSQYLCHSPHFISSQRHFTISHHHKKAVMFKVLCERLSISSKETGHLKQPMGRQRLK